MIFFKKADYYLQLILVTGGFIYGLLFARENFFVSYLIVGGWQLFSFAIHRLNKKGWIRSRDRVEYGKILLWLLIIGVVCYLLALFGIYIVFIYLFIMLLISPFIAIWYCSICWKELSIMKEKNLVHLK